MLVCIRIYVYRIIYVFLLIYIFFTYKYQYIYVSILLYVDTYAHIYPSTCHMLQELRKEVLELRRSVHHSKIESQFLREELRKVGGISVNPAHSLDEKIQLIKEVNIMTHLLSI